MKRPLPTFAKIGIIGLGTLLFLFAVLLVVTRDIPPIDDSDLAIPIRKVNPSQNPFPGIREFDLEDEERDKIRRGSQMLRGNEPMDPDFLDAIVIDFAATLERFDGYGGMTEWQNDQSPRIDSTLPWLSPWMNISEVKRFEIRRLLDQGETTPALEAALTTIRFGENLQKAGGSLIQLLVGVTIVKRGQLALVEILHHRDLDEAALAQLAVELESLDFSPEHFKNTLRHEYQVFKQYLDLIAQGDPDMEDVLGSFGGESDATTNQINTFNYRPNRTQKLFADAYRQMIRESAMVRKDAPDLATAEAMRFRSNQIRNLLSGNAIGRILFSIGIPATESLSDRIAEQRAAHHLLRLQVAIERFRLAHGDFPADLPSLIPEFLDAIPTDPMDGLPLRYDQAAGRLYSVGNNFIDDGGIDPEDSGSLKGRKEVVIELLPAETP